MKKERASIMKALSIVILILITIKALSLVEGKFIQVMESLASHRDQ
jgi:hypothetical protein